MITTENEPSHDLGVGDGVSLFCLLFPALILYGVLMCQ